MPILAWSSAAFLVGWLGGWPGEGESSASSTISAAINAVLIVLVGLAGILGYRALAK